MYRIVVYFYRPDFSPETCHEVKGPWVDTLPAAWDWAGACLQMGSAYRAGYRYEEGDGNGYVGDVWSVDDSDPAWEEEDVLAASWWEARKRARLAMSPPVPVTL